MEDDRPPLEFHHVHYRNSRARFRRIRLDFVHKYDWLAAHAEHTGIVVYSGMETVGLHHVLWWMGLYLFITGLWVMIAKEA